MAKIATPSQSLVVNPQETSGIVQTWRDFPEIFFRSVLNADPYEKQVDVLHSVRDFDKTTVKSCNSAGKDWLGARIALWWMMTWEECTVVLTAPTWHQVENVMWRELNSAWLQSAFPLSEEPPNKTSWSLGAKRFAMGLSTTEKERVMGIHNENVLIIVTEASGMPDDIMDAIDTLTASGNTKLLYLGNPTVTSGAFYDSFNKDKQLFNCITIPYNETPNFLSGGEVVRSYLIQPKWVEERKIKWGEGSLLWVAHVEAEFPSEDNTMVFPGEIINAALNREPDEGWDDDSISCSVGCDVARKGVNKTTLCKIRENAIIHLSQYGNTKTTDVARIIREHSTPNDLIAVDDSGVGGGVVDILEDKGVDVLPFIAGASAVDNKRFANQGSEMWWELRTALDNYLSLKPLRSHPLIKDLIDQLRSIKYEPDGKDRIIVNKKVRGEKWRNVDHDSPDLAEALMIAVAGLTEGSVGAESFMY